MYQCIDFIAQCSDGDLQLVGGPSSDEGRVEYCAGGRWGTICNDTFDLKDATVVCEQLGFLSFGNYIIPILPKNDLLLDYNKSV